MAASRDSEGLVWSQEEGSPRAQWGNRGTVRLGNKDQGQEVFHRFEAEAGAELQGVGTPRLVLRAGMGWVRAESSSAFRVCPLEFSTGLSPLLTLSQPRSPGLEWHSRRLFTLG